MLARHLLRYGLVKSGFGYNVLEDIKISPYGKPLIDNRIAFNLSHSQKVVVCVLTDRGTIGVDVEAVADTDLFLFREWMNQPEWDRIRQSDDQLIAFFEYWTQKEAVIKADGRGLSIPLKDIHLKEESARLKGKTWYLKKVELRPAYICHLAIDQNDDQIAIKEIKMKDFLRPLNHRRLSASTDKIRPVPREAPQSMSLPDPQS